MSSGVERELHHAFEHTKEVYVVWKPSKSPSPFITETATKIFDSVDDAMTYFDEKGNCQKPAFIKKVEGGKFVPAEQMQ